MEIPSDMKPSEVLRHLVDFVEDPEDVAGMTKEEVRAALEAEGVDVEAAGRKLRARLAELRKERPMTGVERIAAERQRQIDAEGYTPEHDRWHDDSTLAVAAALLAVSGTDAHVEDEMDRCDALSWPAQLVQKHHGNRLRQLEIAGALIAAEIDRLQG